MTYKQIEWAYPTSTNAKKLGRYNTGCWHINKYEDGKINTLLVMKPFDNLQECINEAKKLDMPFHHYTLKFFASSL